MSQLFSRPLLRWFVPASAALAVVGGGVAIGALTAAVEPTLPPRSAAQLLVDIQTARLDGLSGTIVQRADLGLPALPGMGRPASGQGSADLSSLITGTHTLRVWYSGPDKVRVALLGTLGETDVITNGTDLWVWSSRENKATHSTLPAQTDRRGRGPAVPGPTAGALTPQQLADTALAAIQPSTEVTTDGTARVAGRDAYELELSPRDAASRIDSVRVAIDAKEYVPLRVQVFPRGGNDPAIEVAFTQISFARPSDAQFSFNPPPGATVVEQEPGQPRLGKPGAGHAGPAGDLAVIGSGWTSVLVVRLPEPPAEPGPAGNGEPSRGADEAGEWGRADLGRVLQMVPRVSGAWGSGHLLTSNLFSALLTDDGRLFVGAVDPERLYQAAADPAARLGA